MGKRKTFGGKTMSEIYAMELHDEIEITPMLDVIRVPGGWIYVFYTAEDDLSHIFVPFNNEFMEAHNRCLMNKNSFSKPPLTPEEKNKEKADAFINQEEEKQK